MKTTFLGSLLIILLLAVACKKENAQQSANSGLVGTWTEQSGPAGMNRSLMFGRDSIYFVIWDSSTPATSQVTYINGTYSTDGHQLSTHFKETVIRQNNNQVIYRAPFIGTLFDNATYELSGNRLVLHYTSYPADAPVATTMVLNRQLPD